MRRRRSRGRGEGARRPSSPRPPPRPPRQVRRRFRAASRRPAGWDFSSNDLLALILGDEALDDDDVEPAAVELAVFFVEADLAKTADAAEGAAGGVEGEDARDELPVAGLGGGGEDGLQELAAQPPTAESGVEIDGELGDAVVAGARAVGAQGAPAGDGAVDLGDEEGHAARIGGDLETHVARRARRRFEGGGALGDALVVD